MRVEAERVMRGPMIEDRGASVIPSLSDSPLLGKVVVDFFKDINNKVVVDFSKDNNKDWFPRHFHDQSSSPICF